ncbi:MAG: DUF4932 domain-containing protein [Maribacter sp.]|nr:MAG: DUF4932 domain-containing protein [Maribacter sp.]
MKLIAVVFFSFLTTISCVQQSNTLEKPKVDERIEILSIVFRLAESEEYSSKTFKLYTDKIQKHYNSYKNHELIQFIKKLRSENGVGYDAVMMMAVHLDDKLNPLIEFNDKVPDARWGKDNAYKFVGLLNKFYQDSDSKEFFKENRNLYKEVSKRFLPIYEHLDVDWYKNFYGKEPNEEFIIINGLGNGSGNYGPSIDFPNGKRKVYAIMGTWKTDSLAMANFTIDSYFPTLLHEFNHSFVNYILDKNPEPFRKNGELIYGAVKDKMNKGSYNSWQTMFNEALVRAAVIKYMKDHSFSKESIRREVNEQINRGFLWIEELVSELDKYDQKRKDYPTLESYFPEFIKAYDTYAENITTLVAKNEPVKPRFLSLSEFANGDTNVNSSIKQITINFDRPFTRANFIRPIDDGKTFPNFTNLTYSDDQKSVILEWTLESNKEYQFILIGLSPESPEENSNEDYLITFKTE